MTNSISNSPRTGIDPGADPPNSVILGLVPRIHWSHVAEFVVR
jgi:hypothetical protein